MMSLRFTIDRLWHAIRYSCVMKDTPTYTIMSDLSNLDAPHHPYGRSKSARHQHISGVLRLRIIQSGVF